MVSTIPGSSASAMAGTALGGIIVMAGTIPGIIAGTIPGTMVGAAIIAGMIPGIMAVTTDGTAPGTMVDTTAATGGHVTMWLTTADQLAHSVTDVSTITRPSALVQVML